MQLGRLNHFGVLFGGLALLTACGQQEVRRDSTALADILRDPSSRALSDRLGGWLDARRGAPQRIDAELVAQGFRRSGPERRCLRYAYRGEPETSLFRDATLRVGIELCGEWARNITVTRGRS